MPTNSPALTQLRREHAAASISVVRINTNVLRAATVNTRVTLNLTPTLRFSGITRESADLPEGRRLWRGEVPATSDMPKGDATIILNGANATGTIVSPNGDRYQLRPVGDGVNALVKLDYAKLPKDDPEGAPPRNGARTPRDADANANANNAADAAGSAADNSADGAPTIDVLVAYTSAASTAAGDVNSLIDLAIAETNTSFQNSGINAKLRLAGKLPITYTESGKSFDTILADFVGNASVAAQRNTVGADVSVLIINQSDYCGKADDIGATAPTAYVIVHYSCATGYYSFGHEIGHLLGARHDTPHDATTTPFAYGHAHLQKKPSGGWRTIMGYNCEDGTCPTRVQYWSSPSITVNGSIAGNTTVENNARVWNERAATVAAFRAPPGGPNYAGKLFQLHNTGRIWRSTGVACGSNCPGWQLLDNNPAAIAIAASAGQLYELHNTGRIWRSTGAPCAGNSCPGWTLLDNNPAAKAIAAAGTALYELHNTGRIWRSTGAACTGNSCPGWTMLDNNPAAKAIVAAGTALYQLHNTGRIWRSTGAPCTGNSCPGWTMLDNNPAAKAIAASPTALYQLHTTGKIWRFTGTPCAGNSCPGWQLLDNNPATVAIFATASGLYQLHNTGKIFRFTGTPCSGTSCPGWTMLDNNPATVALAGDGTHLFQLHNTGKTWLFTGTPCSGTSCPGWLQLDNNAATKAIVGPTP